jgi:hypothetical protein
MRRDYFSVEIHNIGRNEAGEDGEPRCPTLDITFDGPPTALDDRLTNEEGDRPSSTIDVTCRLLDSAEDPDANGVIGVTDRQTGDFLLEANVDAEEVLEFVRAAREYGTETEGSERYRMCITGENGEIVRHDESTFLLYNDEGDLVRRHSLIPSGVEL